MKVLGRMIVQFGKDYVRKSDLSLRVKGKLQERRPSRRDKSRRNYSKAAYKRRERRSASGQPFMFLPTASAHVSAFTCADLIATRRPLVTTVYHSCPRPSATIAVVPQVVMTM